MAISYLQSGIVITDDSNPGREPLILPPDATSDDVAAAALAYLGPVIEPDWAQFRRALRTENGFSAAFSVAMTTDPMGGVALALGLDGFRRDGDPGDFLDALRAALAVLPSDQAAHIAQELIALAQRCTMPAAFIQSLAGES
jgi:hypothetical protein